MSHRAVDGESAIAGDLAEAILAIFGSDADSGQSRRTLAISAVDKRDPLEVVTCPATAIPAGSCSVAGTKTSS